MPKRENKTSSSSRISSFLRNIFENHKATLFAFIIFTFCTIFFYLGNSTLNCTTTLATGPGDQTSGVIWLTSVVNQPLWGPTDISNAPYGENLRTPVFVTGLLQYIFYWFVALFVGPVCGYNLYTAIGFIFSSMVVFLFVKYFLKRSDVAIFAGFAATFTPYLQVKTGVHPSYVFFGVFVIAIWLMILLWQKPSYKKAIALGLVITTFFFIDPYYTLLGGVIIGSATMAFIAYSLYAFFKTKAQTAKRKKLINKIKQFSMLLVMSGVIAAICGIGPLLAVKMKYGEQIDNEVGATRSNLKQEAFTYAARPAEYLPPNPLNPYIGTMIPQLPDVLTRKPHGSNPAENTLSLSLVVILLATTTVVAASAGLLNKKMRKRLPLLDSRLMLVIGVVSVIGVIALLTSFPPKSHGVTFPSDILTSLITIWRVFARLSVVVCFCLAILAAIGLALLTYRLKKHIAIVIVILVTLLVGFEYLTFTPFNDNRAWSYSQVHPFYYWLKNQNDVDIIAEYPLNEPGKTSVSTSYFTTQYIHKKKVINAAHAANQQAVLRNGLRDITDPQTPSALAAMGVDLVVIHAEDKKPLPQYIDGLEPFDWNNSSKDPDSIYIGGNMTVFRVTAKPDMDNLLLVPSTGFSELRINSTYTMAEHLLKNKANLVIINLKTGSIVEPKGKPSASFTAISSAKSPAQLTVQQDGNILWQGDITASGANVGFEFDSKKPLVLKKTDTKNNVDIIISDLNLVQ